MTNEEALKIMQKNRPARVRWAEDYCDAYTIAEDAIGKQIPKKPKMDGYGYNCPSCGAYVPLVDYCPNCGQAIDWSDDNGG